MTTAPWATGTSATSDVPTEDPWAPTTLSGGVDDFWRPADHEGAVHLAVCSGEKTTVETEFGTADGVIVETIIVFSDTGEVQRFDNALVIQKVLQRALSEPGLRLGMLAKEGRAWVWKEPVQQVFDYVFNSWLPDNSTGWPGGKPTITYTEEE